MSPDGKHVAFSGGKVTHVRSLVPGSAQNLRIPWENVLPFWQFSEDGKHFLWRESTRLESWNLTDGSKTECELVEPDSTLRRNDVNAILQTSGGIDKLVVHRNRFDGMQKEFTSTIVDLNDMSRIELENNTPIRFDASRDGAFFFKNSQRVLLNISDGLTCFDTSTGKQIKPHILLQNGSVSRFAVSRDESIIVTASDDGFCQAWDATTGTPLGQSAHLNADIKTLGISDVSQRVVAGCGNNHIYIWKVNSPHILESVVSVPKVTLQLRPQPDGMWLSEQGALEVHLYASRHRYKWNLPIALDREVSLGFDSMPSEFATSTDGRQWAAISHDGKISTGEFENPKKIDAILSVVADKRGSLGFRGKHLRILMHEWGHVFRIWKAESGSTSELDAGGEIVDAFMMTDCASAIVVRRVVEPSGVVRYYEIQSWDTDVGVQTGLAQVPLLGRFCLVKDKSKIVHVCDDGIDIFDAKSLVSLSENDNVRARTVWPSLVRLSHNGATSENDNVRARTVCPNILFSASHAQDENTVIVKKISDGKQVGKRLGHAHNVVDMCFCPESRRLATRTANAICIWDVQSGDLLGSALLTTAFGASYSVKWLPDGDSLLFSDSNKLIHYRLLELRNVNSDTLESWLEARTGWRYDSLSLSFVPLTESEWKDRQEQVAELNDALPVWTRNWIGAANPVGVDTQSFHGRIVNGDFDQTKGDEWHVWSWLDKPESFRIDLSEGRSETAALKLYADSQGNDVGYAQKLIVEKGKKYRLRAWAKTKDVKIVQEDGTMGAALSATAGGKWAFSKSLTGTNDWTLLELPFEARDHSEIEIWLRLGHHGSVASGEVWFDDVELIETR